MLSDQKFKELQQKANKAKQFLAEAEKRKRLAKQTTHLEASYLQEENHIRARGATNRTGSKLPTKSSSLGRSIRKVQKVIASNIGRYMPAGKLVNKVQKAVSFTNWKHSRAITKAATTLVNKFPKFTLPAKTLALVVNKVPFLPNSSAVKFLLPLIKPVARFIPYVGAALIVAEFGIPLLKWGYDLFDKPKTVKRKHPPAIEPSPFTGGQSFGVDYVIFSSIQRGSGVFEPLGLVFAKGRIDGIVNNSGKIEVPSQGIAFKRTNFDGTIEYIPIASGNGLTIRIDKIVRADGLPDTGGNVSPFNPLLTSASNVRRVLPGESPYSDYLPGGSKYQKPTADPTPARQPLEENKRSPLLIAVPAGLPATITTSSGNSVTIAPSANPQIITIPRPLPPQISTAPDEALTTAPLPLTISSPTRPPLNSPAPRPIILTTPGSGPITISIPGSEPYTFTPTGPNNAPLPLSTIRPIGGVQPVTLNPIPASEPATTPVTTPTTTPSPTAPATQPSFNPNDLLIPLGTLGVLLTQIRDRTTPEALETAAAAGTCRTTQPGGCSSNAMNNAANQGSQNTLNALGVGAQGVNLKLLDIMNTKLGPQMLGGISSGLGRLSKSLGIDRLLNVLMTVTVLHNAVMLSGSLKVTLLEMLSSLGNATGLLQTSENENIDLNAVLNKGLNELGELIVGEENWDGIKATYKKHNRIYQAAANIIGSVQGVMNGIANVVSIGAQYTGKIGNALLGNGVIGEGSFSWMNEDVSAKTGKLAAFEKFGETVGETTELLENVSEAAESVVEIQQQATEIVKQNTEFKKTLADATKPTSIENKAVKDAEALAKANATAAPTGEDAEGLLSFIADN